MKKIKVLSLAGLSLLALTGCNGEVKSTSSTATETSTTSTLEQEINYTVKVYDIDGELLFDKALKTKDKTSLFLDLNKETTMVAEAGDFGHFVSSINNSIVDNNYALMLYENGTLSSVGIDDIALDEGDEIVIKNECWNERFDDTEKLLDKAIYKYVKKYLIEDIADDDLESLNKPSEYNGVVSYTKFSNYWTYLCVGLLKDNGYNIDIKNKNTTIYNAIKNYDLTTLSDTDYGKYYYYAKAFDINLDSFKAKYSDFIVDDLPTTYDYGEYSIPFEIAPAKKLNITSDKITTLINTTYTPDTSWGYDGYNWMYIANVLHGKEKNLTYLSEIANATYYDITGMALSIASFAASNVDVRGTTYKKNNKDLVETILESYDNTLGLIKYLESDTSINYSTNQIYSSLIAYKYQRDSRLSYVSNPKAVNIFA